MSSDSFFDGLDDAEDAATIPDNPAAEASLPEVTDTPSEKPAEKEPEAAAKPVDKPTEKAPEVAAEKPAEKPAERPAQPDPRHWVPVGAHVELKNHLKELRAEIEALKNPPKPPAPKPEPPAVPDFTADPRGYVDAKTAAVDAKVAAALEQLETGLKPVKETAEKAEANSAETRFMTHLQNAEQAFVAQNPDYYAALNHLRDLRAREILLLDPGVTQEQMGQILQREEFTLAANILRSGRNPSEVAYDLAKARGYSKPKPPEPPKPEEKKPEFKLPEVPEPKKLAPDLTLGTGTGSPVQTDDNEDPFESAWKEVFGQRKRA